MGDRQREAAPRRDRPNEPQKKMIGNSHHYHSFDESQYLRLGRLAADRDSFLLLFEISRSPKPLNLLQLCGRFRASPQLINEGFLELADMGMAFKRAGTYAATAFGESVIDVIEEIANGFQPAPEVPESNVSSVMFGQPGIMFNAATNNSVRETLSNSASVMTQNVATGKSPPITIATDDNATAIQAGQSEVKNASRNHDYL